MPSGEYNCGNRPLKTARSKPDNTPLTTSAKRCKKTFIGALVFQKVGFVTLLSGTRDTDFQDPGGLAAMCLCGSKVCWKCTRLSIGPYEADHVRTSRMALWPTSAMRMGRP